MHSFKDRESYVQYKQLQVEQAAHLQPSESNLDQPNDIRQTTHVHRKQRPDRQLENKNLMEAHFISFCFLVYRTCGEHHPIM